MRLDKLAPEKRAVAGIMHLEYIATCAIAHAKAGLIGTGVENFNSQLVVLRLSIILSENLKD